MGEQAAMTATRNTVDPVAEQAILCTDCRKWDRVRSDEARAVRWPAWKPGPGTCPFCGGTTWAAEPRPVLADD